MSYNFELALRGLRRFPKSTLLVVLTVALGLSACMTTLVLLHVLSADPLPGRSQHLYLAWVDTVLAKPDNGGSVDMVMNGITHKQDAYRRIKLADAQALLSSHRAKEQAVVVDMFADETSDDGRHTENSQVILATSTNSCRCLACRCAMGVTGTQPKKMRACQWQPLTRIWHASCSATRTRLGEASSSKRHCFGSLACSSRLRRSRASTV